MNQESVSSFEIAKLRSPRAIQVMMNARLADASKARIDGGAENVGRELPRSSKKQNAP
jgi:hypothetical protein